MENVVFVFKGHRQVSDMLIFVANNCPRIPSTLVVVRNQAQETAKDIDLIVTKSSFLLSGTMCQGIDIQVCHIPFNDGRAGQFGSAIKKLQKLIKYS